MGIRLDRYTAEVVKMFGTAQHELMRQQDQNLEFFFEITRDNDGYIVAMKAREITLDLIDRKGFMNAMDFIQEHTAVAIDKGRIKFTTDTDIVPTDDPNDDDGFVIETRVTGGKGGGIFSKGESAPHNTIEMEIWVKGQPESQGMRFLRSHYHQHLIDELKGFGKIDRSNGGENE